MNALPLLQPPEQPRNRRRPQSSPEQRQKHQYRAMAFESVAKLGVNLVISGAAIAALVQLLPYSFTQQQKLKEIQTEVNSANDRVSTVQQDFNKSFDPSRTNEVIQQQTHLINPNEKVVILDPNAAEP